MIFDDDFVQFQLPDKRLVTVECVKIGIKAWPPPPSITITGTKVFSPVYHRTSFSPITDEEREKSKRPVRRGALYKFHHNAPAMTGPGEGKTIVIPGDKDG